MATAVSMDSNSYAVSNRRSTNDSEQEEENLALLQLSSTLSLTQVTNNLCDQEETFMDNNTLKKKSQCFSLLPNENQQMDLHSFGKEIVKTEDDLSVVQEVDNQVNVSEALDDDNDTLLEFEEKKDIKGKAVVSGNLLETEKKRLLAALGGGKHFGAKPCSGNSSALGTNLSMIDDKNGTKGLDFPLRGCLKIEVIDDTALIQSYPVPRTGHGSGKDVKKNGKQGIDGKKARRWRRKNKNMKKGLGGAERLKESIKLGVGRKENNVRSKIMYPKEELMALRFVKVVEQRNFWRYVYNGLGATVMREYLDLGSWKNQKNVGLISDTPRHYGQNAVSPDVMCVVAGRGTRDGLHIFVH